MSENGHREDARFLDREKFVRAATRGVREALRVHKLLGQPIATYRDGKVVWIQPEDIELPPEDTAPNGAAS